MSETKVLTEKELRQICGTITKITGQKVEIVPKLYGDYHASVAFSVQNSKIDEGIKLT
jgi:hypothetical protein